MKRYFLYNPSAPSLDTFDTQEQLEEAAEIEILNFLDDVWDPEVENIIVGYADVPEPLPKYLDEIEDILEAGRLYKIEMVVLDTPDEYRKREGEEWPYDFDYVCDYGLKKLEGLVHAPLA